MTLPRRRRSRTGPRPRTRPGRGRSRAPAGSPRRARPCPRRRASDWRCSAARGRSQVPAPPSAPRWTTRRPTGPRMPRRPTGWSIAAPWRAGSPPHGRWSRVARCRPPRRRRPRGPLRRPGRREPAVAGGETDRDEDDAATGGADATVITCSRSASLAVRARGAKLVDDLVHGHPSFTLSSSRFSARLSRVETAVGLMPSTRAAASPSSSRTIRNAITSRSPALSVASAVSSSGERPSTKRSSIRSGRAAASSRFRRRDSARNQSSAVVRAIPSSHVRALPRRRVEAPPQPHGLLERRAREVLGRLAVARQVEQVAEHVVEVRLGSLGEAPRRACSERLLERHRRARPLYAAGGPWRHSLVVGVGQACVDSTQARHRQRRCRDGDQPVGAATTGSSPSATSPPPSPPASACAAANRASHRSRRPSSSSRPAV